jgi:hypothetical protein
VTVDHDRGVNDADELGGPLGETPLLLESPDVLAVECLFAGIVSGADHVPVVHRPVVGVGGDADGARGAILRPVRGHRAEKGREGTEDGGKEEGASHRSIPE